MAPTKKEQLEAILEELSRAGDVQGSAIVSRDGLVVAANLPDGVDAETLAAMSATMTGAAETVISELKKGSLDRVIAESKDGKLISMGAGSLAMVVALVNPMSNLGLVLVEMKKAAESTKNIIG